MPKFRWAILVFLLPAALYAAYVFRHLGEIDQRNLRLLSKASARVEGVLAGAEQTVTNLGKNFDNAVQFGQTQPYLSPFAQEDVGRLQQLQDWERERQLVDTYYFQSKNRSRPETTITPVFRREGDDLVLRAKPMRGYTDEQEKDLAEEPETVRKAIVFPNAIKWFEFSVELGSILEDLPIDYEFDHLLIADPAGSVVRQKTYRQPFGRTYSAVRISELDQLVAELPGKKIGDNDEDPRPLTFEDLRRSSLIKRVKLASGRFQLLCQPMAVPGQETWALCGLVSSERTFREALAVAPQLALSLLLLLVLGLLAWPFLKLFAMGKRERFRFVDAYFLLICTFATLLLGTVLLSDADAYLALRNEYRASAGSVAATVKSRFETELRKLHEQLTQYDRDVCAALPKKSTEKLILLSELLEQGSPRTSEELELPVPDYPHFTSVFWVKPDGEQFIKGTVRERNTPAVSVRDRPYFKAIQENRTFRLSSSPSGDFFFQTFRSKTTGRQTAALSKRSCLTNRPEAEGTYVAVITMEPRSIMRPLLAPGLSFALVDAGSKVQFHSEGKRSLEEHLFDELSRNDRLRAVMESRTAQSFRTRYRARSHYVHVRPLAEVPWWVVAMFDEELASTVNLEALFQTFFTLSLYLLIANIPIILVVMLRIRRATWLWPDRDKLHFYRRQTMLGLLLGSLFIGMILLTANRFVLGITFLMPLLCLVLTTVNYRTWRKEKKEKDNPWQLALKRWLPDRKEGAPEEPARGDPSPPVLRWHVLAALGLWLVLAILPAFSTFRLAWKDAINIAIRFETLSLLEGLEARQLANPGIDDSGHHLQSPFATSFASFKGKTQPTGKPLDSRGLSTLLAGFKPIYSPSAGKMAYLREAEAGDGSLAWRQATDGSIALYAPGAEGARTMVVKSKATHHGPRPAWFALVGGVIFIIALAGWVSFSAFRIFFGRIERQVRPIGVESLLDHPASVIALMSSPEDWKKLFTGRTDLIVDLGGDDRASTEAKIEKLAVEGEGLAICCRLVSGLADEDLRTWKLRQLQRLVFKHSCRVILPVAVSPFEGFLRFAHGQDADSEVAGGAALTTDQGTILLGGWETRRWARLLAEFALATVELTPSKLRDLSSEDEKKQAWADFENLTGKDHVRKHEVLERKIDRLEGFYWALWTSCSTAEQVTLVQLAQEGFVNPKQHRTVRRLLQRGLVKREPRLRLMDETFEHFVKRIHEPTKVDEWERSGPGFSWHELRWGFKSLLLVLTVFLFATQQGAFDVALSFLSALAVGGIPGLIRIALAFRRTGGREAVA